MKRQELRAIARMNIDFTFLKNIASRERVQAANPASIQMINQRDIFTGKIEINALNGGGSFGTSITDSYIAARGEIIPASLSNGNFHSIDARPASGR